MQCFKIDFQIKQLSTKPIPRGGLPKWRSGKKSACQCRRRRKCGFDSWVGKIPWRRKWQPAPVIFAFGSQRVGHNRARTHARMCPPRGGGGTVHLSFRPASRFTLHSPTSLSLVTKRQTSGSQSVFILWLPSWQMHWGRGILTSGPECPQQSLPLEAKAEEPQAGRRGAPPNCHDPRVPTCGVEAKGDSTLEAGAQRSLGPLDKTCHFTASFLKKYSLDPVFELISVNVLSAVFFFFSLNILSLAS